MKIPSSEHFSSHDDIPLFVSLDCPDVEYETDCLPDEVKCDCECSCIPKSKVCDGINDCCGKFTAKKLWCIDTAKNSIDEQNCPTTCQDGKFKLVHVLLCDIFIHYFGMISR